MHDEQRGSILKMKAKALKQKKIAIVGLNFHALVGALELIGSTVLALGFIASIYMFCIVLCAMNDSCYYYYFPGIN